MNQLFKAPENTDISRAPWMTTMVDTVALVLTFFVMLFSMTTVDTQKWSSVSNSLGEHFYSIDSRKGKNDSGQPHKSLSIFRDFAVDLGYLQSVIEQKIKDSSTLAGVIVSRKGDRILIEMPGDLLFTPGSDLLTDQARRIIFDMTEILMHVKNRIDIEGHTDPAPISTDLFKDNWQLSLARAEQVATYMKKIGFKRPLVAKGYADTRFGDIAATGNDHYKAARRVTIVIFQEQDVT